MSPSWVVAADQPPIPQTPLTVLTITEAGMGFNKGMVRGVFKDGSILTALVTALIPQS